MNIMFLCNYSKTILYIEISKLLNKHKVSSYWYCVNKKMRDKLIAYGIEESQILYLNKKLGAFQNNSIGEYKLNELICADRVLKRTSIKKAQKYLKNIQLPIYEFISSNNIEFVFGELTWSHEILTKRIIEDKKELKCIYLMPHTIRIPSGYFGFFYDEEQSELLYKPHEIDIKKIKKQIFEKTDIKPDYYNLNNKIIAKNNRLYNKLLKLKNFFTMVNIDINDPTMIYNRFVAFKVKGRQELNKLTYKLIKKEEYNDLIGKKYVLIGLHKQPEASIDVVGMYYENQLLNIYNVWRSLPTDWYLVVKEHSNAIGDRSVLFFKKLKKLPFVLIVNENEDIVNLIKNAELVVSVSGTISFESTIYGTPSITFANTFFNNYLSCKKIGIDELKKIKINEFTQKNKGLGSKSIEDIYKAVYKGNITVPSDINDNIKIFEKYNLDHVAQGFINILGLDQ